MSDDLTTLAVNGVLPVSTADRERFTPDRYKTTDESGAVSVREGAPVYLLGALEIRERRAVIRQAVAEAGSSISTSQLRACMREGAVLEFEPEEAAQVNFALDQLEAMEGADEKVRTDEWRELFAQQQEKLNLWQTRLSHKHAPLRELLAMQSAYYDALAILTIRCCVRDWENLKTPYKRKGDFTTKEAMRGLPPNDFEALSVRCSWLRELTQDLEPDSASP